MGFRLVACGIKSIVTFSKPSTKHSRMKILLLSILALIATVASSPPPLVAANLEVDGLEALQGYIGEACTNTQVRFAITRLRESLTYEERTLTECSVS